MDKKTAYHTSVLLAVLCLMSSPPAHAAPLKHHGFMTDPEGKAVKCLSCHDGTVASSVRYCTVQCDFRSSHAIQRGYPPKGKERKYAPLSELAAKGVKLDKGKVTCISCHNLRNPDAKHLITGPGENLCTICHLSM